MVPWSILNKPEQIDEIVAESRKVPVVVYKHSTRCGVSSAAKSDLEHDWDLQPDEIKPYYLDVVGSRDLSHQVARLFGVRHESPQIILIRNGKATFTSSHWNISVDALRDALV